MKYYLSSFRIGNNIDEFKKLFPNNKNTAYISNALDFADGQDWVKKFTQTDINLLNNLGLKTERFDLKKYFQNKTQLEIDLNKYGVIWVSGGNVFVLRQAMALSGFDIFLKNSKNKPKNQIIITSGYL
jgi:dipeptidase E